jgi:uroporphyrinogen-III synthase
VFAPSQVSALQGVLAHGGTTLAAVAAATAFCAIGETTAQALRSAGIEHVSIASAPTPEGMAQAVRSVYPTRT